MSTPPQDPAPRYPASLLSAPCSDPRTADILRAAGSTYVPHDDGRPKSLEDRTPWHRRSLSGFADLPHRPGRDRRHARVPLPHRRGTAPGTGRAAGDSAPLRIRHRRTRFRTGPGPGALLRPGPSHRRTGGHGAVAQSGRAGAGTRTAGRRAQPGRRPAPVLGAAGDDPADAHLAAGVRAHRRAAGAAAGRAGADLTRTEHDPLSAGGADEAHPAHGLRPVHPGPGHPDLQSVRRDRPRPRRHDDRDGRRTRPGGDCRVPGALGPISRTAPWNAPCGRICRGPICSPR